MHHFTHFLVKKSVKAIVGLSIVGLLSTDFVSAQTRVPATNPIRLTSKITKDDNPKTLKTVLTQYSHGDPTVQEQYTLELMNRARANPKEEGQRLINTPDPDVQNSFTYFNVAKSLVTSQFNTYPSRPPLAFNEKLIKAARDHSQDMKEKDFQGHSGSNGSVLSGRLDKAAYTGWSNCGENVFSYAQSMWHAHAGFNVDFGPDNQAQLGHRENIMNFGNYVYTEVGVGVKEDTDPSTQVGKYIVTHDFGKRGDVYLLGVAYKDNNNNGFYDMGEGLPGITIKVSKGNYFAITSSSGGYAIPVTGITGSVTLEASGTGLGGTITKNASLPGTNVKVDFTSALPGQVSLIYPSNESTEAIKDITFTWYKSPGTVSMYNFVLSETEDFTSPLLNVEITDTSNAVKGLLKNAKDYFWKVRAKTQAGWGDFTSANMFQIRIYPKDVKIISPDSNAPILRDTTTLVWTRTDTTAIKYWVQMCEDEWFETNVIDDSSIVGSATTLKVNVEYDRTYFWRICSRNAELWNEFSSPGVFYTVQVPLGIQLVAPVNGFTTSNKNIRFTWNKDPMEKIIVDNPFYPKGIFYWFELAEDSEFSKMFVRDTATKDSTKFIGNMKPGTTYYWHLKAHHEMGEGPFGETRTVKITDPSSVEDDLKSAGIIYQYTQNGISLIAPSSSKALKVSAYSIDGKTLFSNNHTQSMNIECPNNSEIIYIHIEYGSASWILPMQCIR